VDETWTKTNMTPLRGRARVGKRLVGKAPHGHRKTLTVVAALRRDGIHAPWVLDKPINARSFRAWVQTCLVLILHPGDIVVMDNLSSHKAAVIRKAIRAVGAKLFYLPPYSPDLNPIEQVFAKLKTLLRKLNARTVDAVIQAIGQILDGFTAEECAHCFAHAGYRST
jgi:transposase